jgi:CxxC motif-containing protein (DUF1111 family)
MRRLSLQAQRSLFTWGTVIGVAAVGLWVWSPGLPIIWGPSASAKDIAAGRELFEHEWTPNDPLAHGDGLGPVYNAKSCAACHFQGGLGGGGAVTHNAVAFEVGARPDDHEFHSGTLHNFSTSPAQQESMAVLRRTYPVVPGRTIESRDPGCRMTTTIPDFDPVRTEAVQATALFGAGWIDLISDKAIQHNRRRRMAGAVAREMKLDFSSIPVGRVREAEDGGAGKFGWKAQTNDLDQFVAVACANELGLGTPAVAQAKPLAGSAPDSPPDLNRKQVRALVAFVKTLPRPVEVSPADPAAREATARGKNLFATVGCAACHVPDLGGVDGIYSDFLLYSLEDPAPPGSGGRGASYGSIPPPELNLPPRPAHLPKPEEWKTPPLWGVADSAPYFHDGGSPTLAAAISRHRGDAKAVTAAYNELPPADQQAVIAFLLTLKAPPHALPLSDPAVTKLTR